MRFRPTRFRAFGVLAVLVALASTALVGAGAGAASSVRGFDGTTVTVAGLGIAKQFGNAHLGSEARIKRFNDTNEIKGVKINYAEFADDQQDVATTLNEARRLVTQVGVFAIVGDLSQFNPGDYFKQQQVPYFGWAFDNTYCSRNVNTSIWGFGYSGCLVPDAPKTMPPTGMAAYDYVSKKTGKKHPTLVIFGNDSQTGKNSVIFQATGYEGAGFDVVATQNKIPGTSPVTDYTPYVQAAITGNNGQAPDAILCQLSTDCIPSYTLARASGYTGEFFSPLYSNLLVKAMAGSGANVAFVNPLENTPGVNQLKTDMDALTTNGAAKVDSSVIASYASTDMFIQALKTIAKKGNANITPANLQKAAMNQTWQIKGLAGPTQYPKSTVGDYPFCQSFVVADGTQWTTGTPFKCSTKTFPLNPKFK